MAEAEDRNVYLAKLAEQAERYDEMVAYMKDVAKQGKSLSVEERNLLSVAYKNVVGARRASWRIIKSLLDKEEDRADRDASKIAHLGEYRDTIEKELKDICDDVLAVLREFLIPNAQRDDEAVFYHKMKGDYHRYLAEFLSGDSHKEAADKSLSAYKDASERATSSTELDTMHPIRLGLALNFSVFYYEILNSPEKACELAKRAFDDAIKEIGSLSEDKINKDSTLILQLLKDNLTLWTSDMQNEDMGKEELQDVEDVEVS